MRAPGRRSTLVEIAAWVCSALSARRIRAVLVGGAAVSAHTANRYLSLDVDIATEADNRELGEVMHGLGFERAGRVWTHPGFGPTVDFVTGPPAAGKAVFTRFMVIRTRFGSVTVVTPTQAVMDRLAAFYHWNDRQSLEQALLIVKARRVDFGKVSSWSRAEGMSGKYSYFRKALRKSASSFPKRGK